jgi:16S rRNA (adenine1518-N6/adenine1519-N6)-dimethyltransferase
VRLTPRPQSERPRTGDALLSRLVKAAFGQRRKTLANALNGVANVEQIVGAGIDPRARAEQLAPSAFVRLAEIVEKT